MEVDIDCVIEFLFVEVENEDFVAFGEEVSSEGAADALGGCGKS